MPVDPDGFDATSAASTGANAALVAAENDRVATVLAAQRQAAERDRAAALQRGIAALELEPDNYGDSDDDEEHMSLMRETAGFDGGMSRRSASSRPTASTRRSRAKTSAAAASHMLGQFFRSYSSTLRNVLLLAGLAVVTFLFVDDEDILLLNNVTNGNDPNDIDESAGYRYHAHDAAFGGIYNLGHPAGAKAAASGQILDMDDDTLADLVPISHNAHAVQSISVENVLNLQGHYVHDEHRSPYSSPLYDRPQAELDAEQEQFVAKMAKIREEWGAWNFTDAFWKGKGPRPTVTEFTHTPYRDVPSETFPPGSWQTDKEYQEHFIGEARALVDRVREGIYAEYGKPTKKADGTDLSDEERKARDELWGVDLLTEGNAEKKGIAQLNEVSWNGLLRKLLHAILTHDDFYVVLGGHSSAAGHGNNFRQTKAMQFHHLMEPVFDKLGVRLITRNSAQGGVGTTHSAFAGGVIYGEKDIFLWDSSMTERDAGASDTFQKQGIIGGERVPVIFDCPRQDIEVETDGKVWLGTTDMNADKLDHIETTDEKQAEIVPWALRWSKCPADRKDLCQAHKYNSVCWTDRKDVTPPSKQTDFVGGRAGWHPGDIAHKRMARVWCLLVLNALDAALDLWKAKIGEEGGFPLADEHWHVGEAYQDIQNTLRKNMDAKPLTVKEGEEDMRAACEKKWDQYPRVCRIPMKAYGEWQPRAHPDSNSLRSIIKAAPNGYKPIIEESNVYDGVDIAFLDNPEKGAFPRIPDDAVDVHMIAIATHKPAPDLDHSLPNDENERRRLAESSRLVMGKKLQRARQVFKAKLNKVERDRRKIAQRRSLRSLSSLNITATTSALHRGLDEGDEKIIPGQGWMMASNYHTGFCDGSYMSTCARDPGNNCLAIGHNDGRGCFNGDPMAGWIVFTLPDVQEGIIVVRIECWHANQGNAKTKGWTSINDGKTEDTTPYFTDDSNSTRSRSLADNVPDDFLFDIAINGKIKTLNKDEFMANAGELVKNFALWPILDDPSFGGGEVEIGFRLRSQKDPHTTIGVSHIFYA